MTRRELLARLAWLPLLGPVITRLATAPIDVGKAQALLPPIRDGVVFTRVGTLAKGQVWIDGYSSRTLGDGWRFLSYRGNDIVQGRHFGLSTNWRGWVENARGQVVAFVQRDWSVWGTP